MSEMVLCRGRVSREEITTKTSFTAKQLDALAPLSSDDCECLRAFYTPRCETIERLNKRILAAREIKYGVK